MVAIEDSSAAIRDAAVNAEGLDNVELVEGRTEEGAVFDGETPDAVILDPPRAGCHRDALEALARLAPPRVVYVSCDPVTLARDLDVMAGTGYVVESLEPVDMFPQTHHVECVATASVRRPRIQRLVTAESAEDAGRVGSETMGKAP